MADDDAKLHECTFRDEDGCGVAVPNGRRGATYHSYNLTSKNEEPTKK